MTNSRRTLIRRLLLTLMLPLAGGATQGLCSGLLFSEKPSATSLDLLADRRETFRGGARIAFDLCIYNTEKFGQIMLADCEGAPFGLTYIGRDSVNFSLVFNSLRDRTRYIDVPFDPTTIRSPKWKRVTLLFDAVRDAATLSVDGRSYTLSGAGIPQQMHCNFIFGGSRRSIVDVPRIAIRNIALSDLAGGHHYTFPLDESSGTVAHETSGRARGSIVNPEWLINKRHHWEEIGRTEGAAAAGIAFGPRRREIIIINSATVERFNPREQAFKSAPVTPHPLMRGYSGEAVCDQVQGRIYYYNLIDLAGVTYPFFAEMDNGGRVLRMDSVRFRSPLHHHAYAFFPEDRALWLFGGYGNFEYSNDFWRFDFDNYRWERVAMGGDNIAPRMHTVAGACGSGQFFVFGGVGNEIGRQELGKDFFFDLYRVDTRHRTVKRLWSTPKPEHMFVPTRGVVWDSLGGCIYTLCTDREDRCFLQRFDVATGKRTVVSDVIPYPADCILTSIYLFFDETEQEFYAVFRNSSDRSDRSQITIYSLIAPPVAAAALESIPAGRRHSWTVMAATVLAALILVLLYFIFWRRRAGQTGPVPDQAPGTSLPPVPGERPPGNTILLFGELCITDRRGLDITNRFGSKIRQALAMLLLHSMRGQGGVTTEKLSTALWPDKTPTQAKNIRGVTINHLRALLADIDGVELRHESGHWRIDLYPPASCDLLHALRLCETICGAHEAGLAASAEAADFAAIMQRGRLLPSMIHYDWYGQPKMDNEEMLGKAIERLLPLCFAAGHYKEAVRLADILLTIDSYSETAIHFKVEGLRLSGKTDLAMAVRARFEHEYKILYGTSSQK